MKILLPYFIRGLHRQRLSFFVVILLAILFASTLVYLGILLFNNPRDLEVPLVPALP
jgi:hypothetical protein